MVIWTWLWLSGWAGHGHGHCGGHFVWITTISLQAGVLSCKWQVCILYQCVIPGLATPSHTSMDRTEKSTFALPICSHLPHPIPYSSVQQSFGWCLTEVINLHVLERERERGVSSIDICLIFISIIMTLCTCICICSISNFISFHSPTAHHPHSWLSCTSRSGCGDQVSFCRCREEDGTPVSLLCVRARTIPSKELSTL